MSTTEMPYSAVAESVGDAFTEMWDAATQLTRMSARAYVEGLDAIMEQQKLAGESSRQWVSELVGLQSNLGRQAARSYTKGTDRLASAANDLIETTEGAATDVARSARSTPAATRRKPMTTPRRTARQANPPTAAAHVNVAGLTSEDYDSLNAAEVIEKLPALSQQDLHGVDAYEKAHEARQTVVQRIESLRGAQPVAGYDELTVPEVQAQLTAGDVARATAVRDYERSHKKRDGVLHAAQAHIDKA